jgi:hypothetical protein
MPHSVICHQNVEAAKALHARAHEFPRGPSAVQITLHCGAVCFSTLANEFRCCRLGFLVVKENPSASFDKHLNCRGANSA